MLFRSANATHYNRNNDTISGLYSTYTSHVGQIFFDQDLITAVEKLTPYTNNAQTLTTNTEDDILGQELDDNIDRLEELWRLVSTPACRFGPLSRSSVGGDLISWAQFSPGHQDAPVDCYETCCRGRAWSDAGLTQILVCLGA